MVPRIGLHPALILVGAPRKHRLVIPEKVDHLPRSQQSVQIFPQRKDAELCPDSNTSARAAAAHDVPAEEIHWS